MNNVVFWDIMQHGSCKNRCFGGTYRLQYQGEKISELGSMLITSSMIPPSPYVGGDRSNASY